MKNKILILIIGILIGAVLTSIGFYIYQKTIPIIFTAVLENKV